MNKFKRILSILLLGPLLPIIGIPIDNNEDGTGDDVNNDENNVDGNNQQDANIESNTNNQNDKTFTKIEVDEIIQARFGRERNKIRKELEKEYNDRKTRENMTEIEKIKADLEAERKKNEEIVYNSNRNLIRSEVTMLATKLNIVDIDAAFKLMDMENVGVEGNKVFGVEDSLNDLVSKKSWLLSKNNNNKQKVGDDQNENVGKPIINDSMNALIRGYFGKKRS